MMEGLRPGATEFTLFFVRMELSLSAIRGSLKTEG